MDIACKRTLAGSGFPVDQHPALVLRDLASVFPQLLHHPAFADRFDHRLGVLSQTDILPLELVAFESALDRQEQLGE